MAYFANGSEGEVLDEQCASCPMCDDAGEFQCPIQLQHLLHNYDQCNNEKFVAAMNIGVNEQGECQLRPTLLNPKFLAHAQRLVEESNGQRNWMKGQP